MRLSIEVSEEDAEQAINIISTATLRTATDPESGLIDMDMIATGRSSMMKRKIKELSGRLRDLMAANEATYSRSTTLEQLQ